MIARRLIAATLFLVVGLVLSVSQAATEAIGLLLVGPETPLLREAGLRVKAELSSLGFQVILCDLQTTPCNFTEAVGQLELESSADNIHLRAHALPSDGLLEQTMALGGDGLSGEVVAIRAVELLRGALLGSLRSRQVAPETNSALARFTGEEPLARPPHLPAPSPVSDPPHHKKTTPSSPSVPLVWSAHVGPLVYMAGQAGAPSVGFTFASELSVGPLYLGLSAELSPWVGQVTQSSGTTDVNVYSGFARFGWNAPCGLSFDCRLGLALGWQQVQLSTKASEGYLGANAHHESFAFGGEGQLLWHWSPQLGIFGLLRAGGLTNAPVLVDSDSGTLGRPFGSLALGVSYRVD